MYSTFFVYFRYDVVDWTRQFLANTAFQYYDNAVQVSDGRKYISMLIVLC
jgi:hypothetical protein